MPTKSNPKSMTCISSGKFIAWIGFILASFALTGVIVVVADKTTCGEAASVSVVKRTPVDNVRPTKGESLLETENLQSRLSVLELKNSLMRDYLARATAGDADLEWSSFETLGYYGYTVRFDYPSLPEDLKEFQTKGSKGVDVQYSGEAPFWNFSVNINRGPMYQDCTKVIKGERTFCQVEWMVDSPEEGKFLQFEVPDSSGSSSTVALRFSRCRPVPTDRNECLDETVFEKAVDRVLKSIRIEPSLFD